jgi:hypothetical protein
MLTKILFTIAVIAVVILISKAGKRQKRVSAASRDPSPSASRWIKILAISVISLMLVASAVFIYLEWQSANEVLVVQVIDTRSGRISKYRVARGKLDDRAFQTLDGRYVRLAETERMEIDRGKRN